MTFFYAIRHIPSRGFLPQTRESFTQMAPSNIAVPRLFRTEREAVLAMNSYVRGIWGKVYDDQGRDLGSRPMKGTTRDAKDFEVIHMSLVEVKR